MHYNTSSRILKPLPLLQNSFIRYVISSRHYCILYFLRQLVHPFNHSLHFNSFIHSSTYSFIHFIPSFIDVVAAFSCVLCNISCVSCSISSARIVLTAFSFGIYRQLRWLPRSRACSVAFPAMGGLREDQLCLPRSPKSKSFHDSINYSTSKRSHPQSRRVFRSAIAPQ